MAHENHRASRHARQFTSPRHSGRGPLCPPRTIRTVRYGFSGTRAHYRALLTHPPPQWVGRAGVRTLATVRDGRFVRPEMPGASTTPTVEAWEEYRVR